MADTLRGSRELLTFLESLSRGAGTILRDLYGKAISIRHKGVIDLVTEADTRCEEYLLERIEKEDPKAKVLSEEFHSTYSALPGGDCWIIDPLDGTTNFAHSFPWFAVSLCRYEGGSPSAGAVYLPLQDELFMASPNGGAYMNDVPVRVSRSTDLEHALLATGFPYDVHEDPYTVMDALQSMITRAQGVRRAGAASIDLVYVASGRLDGFWEIKLKPWDTAAGALIIQEAGGTVTTFSMDSYDPFIPEILATNGLIHEEASAILSQFSLLNRARGAKKRRNPVPTVDIIIRTQGDDSVVLVERKNPPLGWALPGGFVDYGEGLEEAATREAFEETGLKITLRSQLKTYSDPERDPRLHTITTVFIADAKGEPSAGDDAMRAKVFSLSDLPSPLAFDHERILKDYCENLKLNT